MDPGFSKRNSTWEGGGCGRVQERGGGGCGRSEGAEEGRVWETGSKGAGEGVCLLPQGRVLALFA